MEETGESSSQPVFYGPPRPPEMLEEMRLAAIVAEEEQMLLREEAMIAAGQYCRCEWNEHGQILPPDSDSDEDEPCPFHPWNQRVPGQAAEPQWACHHHHLHDHHHHEPIDADEGHEQDHSHESGHGVIVPQLQTTNSASDPNAEGQVPTESESEDEHETSDDEYVPEAGIGDDEPFVIDYGEDDEDDDDDEDPEVEAARRRALLNLDISTLGAHGITSHQLIGLLQSQNLVDVLNFDDSDDSSAEDVGPPMMLRTRRRMPPPVVKPTVEGMKLQRSGAFGANETSPRSKSHIMRRMLDREHGLGSLEERHRNNGLLTQDMIPEMRAEQIIHYDEPVYSGQFSDDGNFYYSVCQDFKVRMYDTSNPYDWKHYKTVSYPWGSWTLTDASLSPDNKWLVYSSHSALVSIAPTDPLDRGDPYTLNLEGGLEGHDVELARRMNFSIFSIRFSGDGRELVAGTRQNTIVLYDIEKRSVIQTIMGHENDVNAVCFGDKDEPHLIYSGSDDGVLKVWDRRSLNDRREAGAFVGHKGGLTYIDSKNDGRYILSNGKDQTAKLWDVRMAYSTEQFHAEDMTQFTRYSEYDYRYMDDMDVDYTPHPKDNSLVTFRGHKVQRTLIRCHFAPPDSANSRYVYSGSSDGKVHVWNMDSTVAKVIDVAEATKGTRRSDGRRRYFAFDDDDNEWEACVRDVSWHPHAPVMAASAWNSYNMSRGTTSVHSFTGAHGDEDDVPMGRSYNAMLKRQDGLYDKKYD